jgi:TonB family protein
MSTPQSAPGSRRAGEKERRRHLRITPMDIIAVSFDGDNGGLLLEVGENGALVQAVRPLLAGGECRVCFDLPGGPRVDTSCRVTWADPHGRAGLRFVLAAAYQKQVQKWLEKQQQRSEVVEEPLREMPPIWAMVSAEQAAEEALEAAPEPAPAEAEPEPDPLQMLAALPPLIAQQQLDADAALQVICEEVRALTRAQGAAIALRGREGMLCRASTGMAPEVGAPVHAESGLSGLCLRTGQLIHCADTESDVRVNREACRELNLRAVVVTPVSNTEGVQGVLEVFSSQAHAFTEQDLEILRRAARLIAGLAPEAALPVASEEAAPAPATKEEPAPLAPEPQVVISLPAEKITLPPPPSPQVAMASPPPAAERSQPAVRRPSPAFPLRAPTLQTLQPKPAPAPRNTPFLAALAALLVVASALFLWVHEETTLRHWLASPDAGAAPAWQTSPAPLELAAEEPEPQELPPVNAALRPAPPATAPARTQQAPPTAVFRPAESRPAEALAPVTSPSVPVRPLATVVDPAPEEGAAPPPATVSGEQASVPALVQPSPTVPALPAPTAPRVTPAELRRRVQPVYPAAARAANIQGTVVLEVTIGRDGGVRQTRQVSGHPMLLQAALDAVRRWQYEPATLNGQPVESTARVTIHFTR